jgi:hypothetical protein
MMTKFVWIDVENGGRVPINPDQVRYLRRTRQGKTAIIFGAIAGGFDEVISEASAHDVVAMLEGKVSDDAEAAEAAASGVA